MFQVPPSPRLQFSFVDERDSQFLFDVDQDPAVMKYINGGVKTSFNDIQKIMLPRLMSYADPLKGWGIWKVTCRFECPIPDIGWILVRPMGFFTAKPQWDNLELGWRFKQAAWGKGFASEAASAVMQALMKQQAISHFSAICLPGNEASIGVMKKLGMTFSHQEKYADGVFDDVVAVYQR